MEIIIKDFLKEKKLLEICQEYSKGLDKGTLSKNNIFSIISNTYYKEDFHSDVLMAILDQDNDIFMDFIDLLNSHNESINISKNDYLTPIFAREKGRIDILIKDKKSKHAIIIENKINNAVDQPRQLPKYYDYVTKKLGLTVDAIVYLSFDGVKHPVTNDWNKKDKKNVFSLLCKVAAYNTERNDIHHMLSEHSQLSKDDIGFLTRQYSELLKVLAKEYSKDISAMKEFYNILSDENSCKTIRNIVSMYNRIPTYYAKRTQEEFKDKPDPFQSIQIHREYTAFFNTLVVGSSDYAIDVIHTDRNIVIDFFDRNYNYDENTDNPALTVIEKHNPPLSGFIESANPSRYRKTFKFPEQEREVYPFIREFLSILSQEQENPT